MSIFSGASVVSVGNALANTSYVAPGVPMYDKATREVVDEVRRQAAERASAREKSPKVLMPYALDAAVVAYLIENYPEYIIKPTMAMRPVSALWQAHRFMALNLCIDALRNYTDDVVCIGNAVFQAATRGLDGVHIELDSSSVIAAHDYHESGLQLVQTIRASERIFETTGVRVPKDAMKKMMPGGAHYVCGDGCGRHADAVVFDLSTYEFSVDQAASAMAEVNANIGQAFIPYTPGVFQCDTLGSNEGTLCEHSGVDYVVEGESIAFMYREGVAGVTRMRLSLWLGWLKTSTVRVNHKGRDQFYRVELMQHREPFMYARIVRCADAAGVPSGTIRHALEMPWAEDKLMLSASKLRSVRADPKEQDSWVSFTRIVSKSAVEKLLIFSLTLTQQQFTPETILRRAATIDTRTVLRGTNLRIREPISVSDMMDMSTAVFCKAFIIRYNTGKLSQELMTELRTVKAFAGGSNASRLSAIASACAQKFWASSVGTVAAKLRELLVGWYSRLFNRSGTHEPSFDVAPKFLLLSEYNTWYTARCSAVLKKVMGPAVSLPFSRGARTLIASGRNGGTAGVTLPDPGVVPVNVTGTLVDDIVDTSEYRGGNPDVDKLVDTLKATHDVTRSAMSRFDLQQVIRKPEVEQGFSTPEYFQVIPDPASTIDATMEQVFPGMYKQDFEQDEDSMRFDPQARDFDASLTLPAIDPTPMTRRNVYRSHIKCYNTFRKGQNLQETLSALQARTLSAPRDRVACDEDTRLSEVLKNMKSAYFKEDADACIERFMSDSVGFEVQLLEEWGGKATSANIKRIMKILTEEGKNFEDLTPWDYQIMLKSDAKPPMSGKAVTQVIPPQLIVMQDKLSSAMFSSIFRLMSRRFVSLLRPEIMLNLLKSTDDIRDHIAANHDWEGNLKYLENDFGKFDKSQDGFSYRIVVAICEMLGFNQELLDRWRDANSTCTLRSVILMMVVVIEDQNKSGGPATAFMNGIANMAAVATCYAGTRFDWAVFMGDDSLCACRKICASQQSLNMMTEWFNFESKFFVLKHPYFTSSFIVFDCDSKKVHMFPDPIKRAQKLSVAVSAVDPKWAEMQVSLKNTLTGFRHSREWGELCAAVTERYGCAPGTDLEPLFHALGTVSSTPEALRGIYEDCPTVVLN